MYTILVSETNELVTTVRERIMQRSKLVDNLHFLMAPTYKGFDMRKFTAVMEFITPISREFKTEILTQSPNLYKDMIEYKLAIDTVITKEAGPVEIVLTFTYVEMDEAGNVIQHVRKTSGTTLDIIAVPTWCNVVPDSALAALDQRLIAMDARINALNDLSAELDATKADNIKYDESTDTIQLVANGELIGDAVVLKDDRGVINIEVNQDNHMIVHYDDGTTQEIGVIGGGSGASGIYVPSISENGILTFTLQDSPGEETVSYDLNPNDEWSELPEEGIDTVYKWEYL